MISDFELLAGQERVSREVRAGGGLGQEAGCGQVRGVQLNDAGGHQGGLRGGHQVDGRA